MYGLCVNKKVTTPLHFITVRQDVTHVMYGVPTLLQQG